MKFYESHFDDYSRSVSQYNFHDVFDSHFQHYIFYGPHGSGKFSQLIHFIKNLSPFKFEQKLFSFIDKHPFFINFSDIHYEIDMSLLGCNSRIIWHDVFSQIVDIISSKSHHFGFIVCKNFHDIHIELLDIFYSYMNVLSIRNAFLQRNLFSHINFKFIFITQHLSFIPLNIINLSFIVNFERPSDYKIIEGIGLQKFGNDLQKREKIKKILKEKKENTQNTEHEITNLKEVYSYTLMNSSNDIPIDNFNVICNNIIEQINQLIVCDEKNVFVNYPTFRDIIYDILVYNLDALDAIRYIFFYYLKKENVMKVDFINKMLDKLTTFMFQYSNNYRSFFHLENFFFSLVDSLRNSS